MVAKKTNTKKKAIKSAKSKLSREEKNKLIKEGQSENLIGDILTVKQELFCQYYTQNSYYRGNGLRSYAAAYDIDLDNKDTTRQTDADGKEIHGTSELDKAEIQCAVFASRLIRNDKVQLRCRELMLEMMKDDVIDERLTKIILNGSDQNSLAAIKEYNALKQRIEKKISMNIITEADKDSLLSKLSEVEKLDE